MFPVNITKFGTEDLTNIYVIFVFSGRLFSVTLNDENICRWLKNDVFRVEFGVIS